MRLKALRPACILFLLLVLPSSLVAEDLTSDLTEIVISPNRSPKPINKVSSSITVITSKDMEEKRQRTVIEAISAVPGVQVVQSGGLGGNVGIFMRGANAEHTLIIVDGVEVNDPVSTARLPSIANMTLDNIERIEILRGPQSVLYGSDALGGVINIITRTGQGDANGSASVETGSYHTSTEKTSVNGEENGVHYSLAGSRIDSGSISQADAALGNSEHDQYDNTSFSGKVDVDVADNSAVTMIMRSHLSHTDLDNFGGAGGDDPNRFFSQRQYFSRIQAKSADLFDGLVQTFGVSYSKQRYTDTNSSDDTHPIDSLDSKFESDMVKYDFLNTLDLDPATISIGLESENERASSYYASQSEYGDFTDNFPSEENRVNSAFVQTDIDWLERFNSTAGVRVDDSQHLDPEVTWRAGQNIQIPESGTILRSSVGTGFKVPSLFQRYSQYGRDDLKAEKSLGVDAGVEQTLFSGDVILSATYFWNSFDNLITFDSGTFLYQNVNDARTQGMEFSTKFLLPCASELELTYTFTRPQDRTNDTDLLRRARHKVGFDLRSKISEQVRTTLSGYYIGQRLDNDFATFPATTRYLGGYTIANAVVTYEPVPQFEIYAKLENIFDREYQSVIGFGAPGAAGYGGIIYHF